MKHKQYIDRTKPKRMKKYFNTDKGKEAKNKAQIRYRTSEKCKIANRRYVQSEKGKMAHIKMQTKRIRKLNFIPMFDNPFDESIEYHHITDTYVVAIPKDLHQLYYGKNHRENTMEIVKQIY